MMCSQFKDERDHIELGLQDISEKFYIPQKLYGRETEINDSSLFANNSTNHELCS
jgi:hypothetical protein